MKKGISIVSLGIALIILTVIVGIVVINSKDFVNETKKSKFVTEYMLVETGVRKYYDDNQSYPIKIENETEKKVTFTAATYADLLQFGDKANTALTGIELKVIDLSLLGFDDLTIGWGKTDTDYYGITDDGDIYYVKGVKYKDFLYYKVTDALL